MKISFFVSLAFVLSSSFGGAAEAPEMIELAQFNRLVQAKKIKLNTQEQAQLEKQNEEARKRELNQVLNKYFQTHPEELKNLNPNISPFAKPRGDGTFAVTVPNCRKSGNTNCGQVVTLGIDDLKQSFASTLSRLQTEANLNDQFLLFAKGLREFKKDHPEIKLATLNKVDLEKLPSLTQFQNLKKTEKLQILNAFKNKSETLALHERIKLALPNLGADRHLLTCNGMIGQPSANRFKGDRLVSTFGSHETDVSRTESCSEFDPEGIMKNINFSGRSYLTCVKNQEARGTCWAFAIASSMESSFARMMDVQQGAPKFVNLSEQTINYTVKALLRPSENDFQQGANASVIQDLIQAQSAIPLEKSWIYNQAREMIVDERTKTFRNKCMNYENERNFCSDTNHEGKLFCARIDHGQICGYLAPDAVAQTSDTLTPTSSAEIWDREDVDTSISMTLLALLFKTPVFISIQLFPEFFTGSSDGWSAPPGFFNQKQESHGAHAMHVVGFVSEAQLLGNATLKNKVLAGNGGGYFVVKNSWGTCSGDGGYYYIPMSFFKKHVYSAVTITGVR